jgi:hypothetical protein
MAKWCNSLCDFCQYDRDVAAAAMSCVDRFAASSEGFTILMDRDKYQLAVMTSLYLVAKIQQLEALDPDSVAGLSRGKHTKADIEAMELELLVGLRWRVHPPTSWAIAQELLNLIPANLMDVLTKERIVELTKFQLEVGMCHYNLGLNRPSTVALGAILNAMESLNDMADLVHRFEQMASQVLATTLDEVRDVRMALLTSISEDSSTEPKCAEFAQRMSGTLIALSKEKEMSSSSFNSSPRCVSATFC